MVFKEFYIGKFSDFSKIMNIFLYTVVHLAIPLCFTDFNLGEYFTFYFLKYCKKKL